MRKNEPVLSAFGGAVRRLRETRGLTQEALAEGAELDRTYISDIERGFRNPGVKNIVRVAKALGISASDLLSEAML